MKSSIVIHGGAGTIAKGDPRTADYQAALNDILARGFALLQNGSDAVDVVTSCVSELEGAEAYAFENARDATLPWGRRPSPMHGD